MGAPSSEANAAKHGSFYIGDQKLGVEAAKWSGSCAARTVRIERNLPHARIDSKQELLGGLGGGMVMLADHKIDVGVRHAGKASSGVTPSSVSRNQSWCEGDVNGFAEAGKPKDEQQYIDGFSLARWPWSFLIHRENVTSSRVRIGVNREAGKAPTGVSKSIRSDG